MAAGTAGEKHAGELLEGGVSIEFAANSAGMTR